MTIIPTFLYNGLWYTGWTEEDALAAGVPQGTIDAALLLIEDQLYKTFYIDSIAGDDANSGKSSMTPWKTFARGLYEVSGPNSQSAQFWLAADGAYTIPYETDNRIISSDIRVGKYTAPTIGEFFGRTDGTPTLTQPNAGVAVAPTKAATIALRGGSIHFKNIHLITADDPVFVATCTAGKSMLTGNQGGAFSGAQFTDCTITVNAAPFIETTGACLRSVMMTGCTIYQTSTAVVIVVWFTNLVLAVQTTTIPEGTRWPDGLIYGLLYPGNDHTKQPYNAISGGVQLTYT